MNEIDQRIKSTRRFYRSEDWKKDFACVKAAVEPSIFNRMHVVSESYNWNATYHGKTMYQYYCSFINDILRNIRKGNCDYCFSVYQVADVLRYEYDKLQVDWLENERCFLLRLKK